MTDKKYCFSCSNLRDKSSAWKWVFRNGKRSHQICPSCVAIRSKA